jgi:hypothetical protein
MRPELQTKRGGRALPSLLLFLVLTPLASGQTSSSSVQRLSNEELVSRSNLVIYGVARKIRNLENHKEVIIQVEGVLKGTVPADGKVAVIFSPGMEDSPLFTEGECVLLFLIKTDSERFQTTGGFQGKFSFGRCGK